ncbi:MAG: GIY-YIG nuclease family protein [Cetobacterium sp.]
MICYILKDKLSGLYKIGRCKNFDKRFNNLSTSNIN